MSSFWREVLLIQSAYNIQGFLALHLMGTLRVFSSYTKPSLLYGWLMLKRWEFCPFYFYNIYELDNLIRKLAVWRRKETETWKINEYKFQAWLYDGKQICIQKWLSWCVTLWQHLQNLHCFCKLKEAKYKYYIRSIR